MQGKMKVAIMTDIGKIEYTQRDIPTPKPDEVLVQLAYVGICGSDMHYFEHGGIGDFKVSPPFVLGHEPSGVVAEVGADVEHLKKGDRVTLEPGKTCGLCEFCKTGRYNLCPDVIFFATPPVDGIFQEYTAHQADLCFKIPDHVGLKEASMIEPLAVGFHAAMQGGAKVGQTAVVTGAGAIGLVSLLALKAMGVTQVYVIDVLDNRLERAAELGATAVINGMKEDVVKKVMELTNGAGFDLGIETSGAQPATVQLIKATKKGGTIVLVGYSASGEMTLPVSDLLNKEITIKTVFRYRHIYPLAIEAVAAGNVDVKKLISHHFEFDDLQNAMDRSIKEKNEIVKSVVRIADLE